MNSGKTFLNELSTKTRSFTVRVKVIEKHRVQTPYGKSTYQHVFLEDDKGNKMKATLFSTEIQNHADSLLMYKKYDISNGIVNPVNAAFRQRYGDYQLTITNRTIIVPVDEGSSNVVTQSIYRPLSLITPQTKPEEEFDVIVLVLYVGATKTVTGGRKVRDMVVTDDSTEDTMIVSGWNDFADNECAQLAEVVQNTPVVGFSNLKRGNHKVFSVATTMSTFLSLEPKGDKADSLKNWKAQNSDLIKARKAQIEAARATSVPKDITTIKDALAKTAQSIMQEEIFRLKVYIPDFKRENMTVYVGCKLCGRKCKTENNLPFVCEFCERQSTAVARLFFNFTATDGSDSINLVAYTENAEKILQVKADRLLLMTNEDIITFCQEAQSRFRTPNTCIDVVPIKPAMPHMKIFKWVLKDVLVE